MLSSEVDLGRIAWKVFTQANQLTLKAEAVKLLKKRLLGEAISETELFDCLNLIAQKYKQTFNENDGLVDATSLEKVIDNLLKNHGDLDHKGDQLARSYLLIQNMHECPKWDYNAHERKFVEGVESLSVLGEAGCRNEMFRRRYEIIKQSLFRSDYFCDIESKITSIKSIKVSKSDNISKILIGMLSCLEEGKVFLEDPEDFIQLNFTQIQSAIPSAYTEGSIVILEGYLISEGTLLVTHLSPPPAEPRRIAQFHTHPRLINPLHWENAPNESHFVNEYIIFLSDLWLDCERTMTKFEALLNNCEKAKTAPMAFVIMGPFSVAEGGKPLHFKVEILKKSLDSLASLISKYPLIQKNSTFIFIPSFDDCLSTELSLQAPYPADLISTFQSFNISATFASNPCHLFFFNREIVVYRRDISKFIRQNLLQIDSNKSPVNVFEHLISQAHLNPFSLSLSPSLWNYDHCLCLYPSPNFLVLAERTKPDIHKTNEVVGINPGSFATSNYSFTILYPISGNVQSCRI